MFPVRLKNCISFQDLLWLQPFISREIICNILFAKQNCPFFLILRMLEPKYVWNGSQNFYNLVFSTLNRTTQTCIDTHHFSKDDVWNLQERAWNTMLFWLCCIWEDFQSSWKKLSILLCINTAGLKLNLAKCHLRSSFLQCIFFSNGSKIWTSLLCCSYK